MTLRYLITAALPYINNVPHLGHIVGSHLPADVFYRFCKMRGYDCTFVGGSDEYGTPSLMAARKLGVPVRQLVDALHPIHKEIYRWFGISYDNYSRTSNEVHTSNVNEIFHRLIETESIDEQAVEMYYCANDDLFLSDRFVVGRCPRCNYSNANGDQCEQCGYLVNVGDLIEPICILCDKAATVKTTKHLFFKLTAYEQAIGQFIDAKKGVWRDTVVHIAQEWLKAGLRDRSITRDLPWGVKINRPGYENKVLYVWFEALMGYVSFTKELGPTVFEKYWKDKDSRVVHFLGKDNIPFHTVFWPAILMAHGRLNFPYSIAGYQYLTFEGKKFSKSERVGVFCYGLPASGIDVDTLRSYLVQILPESKDADFKWEEYKTFVNSELIGKFGNFFNRVISMINRYFGSKVGLTDIRLDAADEEFVRQCREKIRLIDELLSKVEIKDAYKEVMNLAMLGNQYLSVKAPWDLAKANKMEEAGRTLFICLNLSRALATLAYPFTPFSMERVWKSQLKMNTDITKSWDAEDPLITLPPNHEIGQPEPLYKKVEDSDVEVFRQKTSSDFDLNSLVR